MAKSPTPSSKIIARGASASKSNKAAPIARVSVSDGKTERTVSVRKIENGYIVSESTYGGRGGYKCTERFTDKAPTLDVSGPKGKK